MVNCVVTGRPLKQCGAKDSVGGTVGSTIDSKTPTGIQECSIGSSYTIIMTIELLFKIKNNCK